MSLKSVNGPFLYKKVYLQRAAASARNMSFMLRKNCFEYGVFNDSGAHIGNTHIGARTAKVRFVRVTVI